MPHTVFDVGLSPHFKVFVRGQGLGIRGQESVAFP